MPRRVPAPLPVRDGLNPTRLVLPGENDSGGWPTVLAYLNHRFPSDQDRLAEKVRAGEVLLWDTAAQHEPLAVTPRTEFRPHWHVYLYRDPPLDEPVTPGLDDLRVLHHDERLLVIDKPHGVATTPRGAWVRHTALVRLRQDFGLPELVPAHRLDRLTAGVLVFVVRPEVRGAYQTLFENRRVAKTYEAVAPLPNTDSQAGPFPIEVCSRIVKYRGIAAAQEVPGEPNAHTVIDLIADYPAQGLGHYRLRPLTGKTHQLRLHLNRLGTPILGDPFWPSPQPWSASHGDWSASQGDWSAGEGDWSAGEWGWSAGQAELPLQLLARSLAFTDPITGKPREFVSNRSLAAVPTVPTVPNHA